jgi:hypothetical protein
MNSIINNEALLETLELEYREIKGLKKLDLFKSLAVVLMVICIIFFFTCPIIKDYFTSISYHQNKTMLLLTNKTYIYYLGLIIPIGYLLVYLLLKDKLKLITTLILSLIYLGLIIYIPCSNNIDLINPYYYLYYVVTLCLIILPIIEVIIKRKKKSC